MVKVFPIGSTGLEAVPMTTLVEGSIMGFLTTDKLNGTNDIEFTYPIISSPSSGVAVVDMTLKCNAFKCGQVITNQHQNESKYLQRYFIINKDGNVYIVYAADIVGSTVKVKGSDYVNLGTIQQMLDANTASNNAIKNDVSAMRQAVATDKSSIETQIANNQVNYNASMAKIKTDNETYIKNYGVFTTFA